MSLHDAGYRAICTARLERTFMRLRARPGQRGVNARPGSAGEKLHGPAAAIWTAFGCRRGSVAPEPPERRSGHQDHTRERLHRPHLETSSARDAAVATPESDQNTDIAVSTQKRGDLSYFPEMALRYRVMWDLLDLGEMSEFALA
jgi:hypothetical protein